MIDHTGFAVRDFAASKAFYAKALAPLDIALLKEYAAAEAGGTLHAGFGANGKPFFWIGTGAPVSGYLHIAFATSSRAQVDAFYGAALAAGGRDNGPPGLRPQYHASYYGAFVLDPDGNNIEAVTHRPE